MRKALFLFAVLALLANCKIQLYRTDAEMLEAATEVYQDYLFEYGIDSALLSSPIVETRSNGDKSYKWIAKGSEGNPIGIEVIVTKSTGVKPEMILIGDTKAWLPLVGSKNKK